MPDEEIAKLDATEQMQSLSADLKAMDEGLPETDEQEEKIISPEVDSPVTEKGAQTADPLQSPSEEGKTPTAASTEPETASTDKDKKPETLAAKADEEFDKELDEIQATKGAHPGTKKALGVVKARAKELNAKLRETSTELEAERRTNAELKARAIPQEVEKELGELRQFRQTFGMENDPELVGKFDKRIEQIESESLTFLKSLDLSEPIEKFITANGGIAAVRYSSKPIKDPQNPEQTITVEQWFNREILGNMDGLQQRKVQKLIDEELDLRDEKDKTVQKAKQNSAEYVKQRHEAYEGTKKAWFEEAEKAKSEFLEAMGPVSKKIEVKPDMPEEEKARATKHNSQVDYVHETFPKLLSDNTPKGRAAIAMSALQARYLTEYIQEVIPQKDAEIADLKAKYEATKEFADKVKSSGRTAKQSNAAVDKKAPSKPLHLISDDSAMKELDKL